MLEWHSLSGAEQLPKQQQQQQIASSSSKSIISQLYHVLCMLLKVSTCEVNPSSGWDDVSFCDSITSVASAANHLQRATEADIPATTNSSSSSKLQQEHSHATAAAAHGDLRLDVLSLVRRALEQLAALLLQETQHHQLPLSQPQQQQGRQQRQQQQLLPYTRVDGSVSGRFLMLQHLAHSLLMVVDACLFRAWTSSAITTTITSSGSSSSSSGSGSGSSSSSSSSSGSSSSSSSGSSSSLMPVLVAAAGLANILFTFSSHYNSLEYTIMTAMRLRTPSHKKPAPPALLDIYADTEALYSGLTAAALHICLCCGPLWGPGRELEGEKSALCADHRRMRLAITLLALVAPAVGLQEGSGLSDGCRCPNCGSGAISSSSSSSSRGECNSSSPSSGGSNSSSNRKSNNKKKQSKAAAAPAATLPAASAVAALPPAAAALLAAAIAANSESQQLWQQLGLPSESWVWFVEAWGGMQPRFNALSQAMLSSSNVISGDSGGSSSSSSRSSSSSSSSSSSGGPHSGGVEAAQGQVVMWLAQSLNFGLLFASTGVWG
jgi:hypothetical protein